MIENLPSYVNVVFIISVLITIYLFYKASRHSKVALAVSLAWLVLQGVLGWRGFYTVTDTIPPRFALLAPPALLVIVLLFVLPRGKAFIDNLDLKMLTWIHVVRILVEISLDGLYKNGSIPQVMTFEGRNFDILSGITAPLMVYLCFKNGTVNRNLLLLWNVICLLLLANVVITAVLAVPTPFQQLAFDHPNIGVLYFPFIWLPCYVVPVVFFAHLAAIRRLATAKK